MLGTLKSRAIRGCLLQKWVTYRLVTCWKCGNDQNLTQYFCGNANCAVVQALKLKDVNAFHLFQIDQKYFIDADSLESGYKNAQKLLHPDMFTGKSNAEREASNETSSTVNQAYQILCSPVCRAEYMLKIQFGIDAFEEGKILSAVDNNALMMEVFEVRERISDTDNAADLQRLLSNVKEDIAQIERAFASSLESANEARAVQYAVRLKYYHKMMEEIEEKLPTAT